VYRERNEEKRAEFTEKIDGISTEDLIYLDESGVCGKMQRTHGRSCVGERVLGYMTGKRALRTNIIGAYSKGIGLFASELLENITVNKQRFTNWLKEHLVPYLTTRKVVIMDNAPWHKGEEIEEIITSTGAKLIFLPPYSPDLNPIEHAWANLKQHVKTLAHQPLSITQKIHNYINCKNQSIEN
jgi:transposase